MKWDIINTDPIIPRCIFCDETTKQMARFQYFLGKEKNICSDCAIYVKDAMNEWDGVNYIGDVGKHFDSKYIDKVIEENKDKALFPDVGPSEIGYHRRGKRLL